MELILDACRVWRPEWFRSLLPSYSGAEAGKYAYLDHAATAQRLGSALRAQFDYESSWVGNAHRGSHALAAKSSQALESARAEVGGFLGVDPDCCAFASGATEAANMLASAACKTLGPNDMIYISAMEHHSNYLPWLEAAAQSGASWREIPVDQDGSLNLDWFEKHAKIDAPKWIAVSAMSNVTGNAPPIEWLSTVAKQARPEAMLAVDACQACAHLDPAKFMKGADWAFFSGHKVHGPAGIGVLAAASESFFDQVPPGKFGGGMIRGFGEKGPKWAGGHARFEAGSANVGGAIGLAAALQARQTWDREALAAHEEALAFWLARSLERIEGVRVLGNASARHGLVSFTASWAHAHDIGTVMDAMGVLVRVGHHCALPLMSALGVQACVRVSFGPSSTESDAVAAFDSVVEAKRRFS